MKPLLVCALAAGWLGPSWCCPAAALSLGQPPPPRRAPAMTRPVLKPPPRIPRSRVFAASSPAARSAVGRGPKPEWMEMVESILRGEMGPGKGWFHPGRGIRDWHWLRTRFDRQGRGRITREDFHAPPEYFDRLDRNRDGALTADDFARVAASPMTGFPSPAALRAAALDADQDGRISRAEWDRFFTARAGSGQFLTADDLQDTFLEVQQQFLRAQGAMASSARTDPSEMIAFARGFVRGDLGAFTVGPRPGERPPDFCLRTADGKQTVRLANVLGKQPVVLIFGSFT